MTNVNAKAAAVETPILYFSNLPSLLQALCEREGVMSIELVVPPGLETRARIFAQELKFPTKAETSILGEPEHGFQIGKLRIRVDPSLNVNELYIEVRTECDR